MTDTLNKAAEAMYFMQWHQLTSNQQSTAKAATNEILNGEEVRNIVRASELLMAAKKHKKAFGEDDKDYQQLKNDGWYLLGIALTSINKLKESCR